MATIVLEGPGKNALGTPVMQKALSDIRAAGEEPLLLTGAGDSFSAGLNLKEIAFLDGPGLKAFLGLLDELVHALFLHPAPVVAHVNGHAIAGGCILAMCCDQRVASDDPKLRIGLNEVALGLEFPPKIMRLARARLAPPHLERVLLEAGTYDPARALSLGLVDEVASGETARARAEATLGVLANHPRKSYAAAKRALREGVLSITPEEATDFDGRMIGAWLLRRDELVAVALGNKRET